MEERYLFRKIEKQEIPAMFALIMRRVAWMDTVGIRQWNTTDYAGRYPLAYYEERRQKDEVFVLEDKKTGELVCVGALFHTDDRWPEPESALYLHHFASEPEVKGVGSIYLQAAERYAKAQGKRYMRLDSAVGNQTLEAYYTCRGYVEAGRCVDGLYQGILRQKELL